MLWHILTSLPKSWLRKEQEKMGKGKDPEYENEEVGVEEHQEEAKVDEEELDWE